MERLELLDGRVDLRRALVVRGEGRVPLTTREVELLAYVAQRAGRVVGWEELHREVWRHGPRVVSRAAYFTWRRLVQKVEPDPERPAHLLTHHGDGVSFVPVGGARPLPAPAPLRTNLGADGTSFVGRAAERARIASAVAGGARLVSVVGPAGAGKSRLARSVAEARLAEREVWFCPLDDVGPGGVQARLLSILGLGEAEDLAAALQARRAWVVLDGCEGVIREVSERVGAWLTRTREVVFLLTSRERTHRADEVVVEVGPLDEADAVALFLDRVRQVEPDRDLPEDAVRELVRRLDALPLALELAAARARLLSPEALSRRLDDRFGLLQRRGDPGRHGSLWAALERSWELAEPALRDAWARLSVTRGGFDLEAAEALLGPQAGLDRVEALCDASIVHLAPGPGPVTFGLYESLSAFADQRTDDATRADARRRHAEVYADRARRRLAAGLQADPEVPAALARERANFEAALAHADDAQALDLLLALAFEGAGRRSPRLAEALDRRIALGAARQAELRMARARLRSQAGDHLGAAEDARAARAACDPRADLAVAADAEIFLVTSHPDRDPLAALEVLERIDPAVLPPLRASQWLASRSNTLVALGRPREGRALSEEQLRRAEQAGQASLVRQARVNLALADLHLGRPERAAAALEELCAAYVGRDAYAEATALNLLGCARLATGEYPAAEDAFHRARELHLRNGATGWVAQVEANLALTLRGAGRSREAMAWTRRALEAHTARRNRAGQGLALLNLALDALACGDRETLDEAIDRARPLATDPLGRLRLGCVDAMRLADRDAPEAAEAALAEVRGPAEGEAVALLAVAAAWVERARGRSGGEAPEVRPPDPMPPFAVVRFAWDLLRARSERDSRRE